MTGRAASARRTNIGPATDSFVGRERALADLTREIAVRRVVTVVGAPGVGKSRLAEEAGRLAGHRSVFRGDVSDAIDAASLRRAITGAVGGAEAEVDDPTLATKLEALAPVLVVIDGADRLDSKASATIAAIVARVSGVSFLITSRHPLRIAGEIVFELAPLESPAATELFVDRVRSEVRSFELGPAAVGEVAKVVDRLGGLPLAIELAAARHRVLGLADLAVEIERGLGVLKPRAGDARPSLDEAFARSWESLGEVARAVFSRASVFTGPFSLDAATAVLAIDGGKVATLDVLEALVDRSLLATVDGLGGARRFRLLAPLRAFAASQLAQADVARIEIGHAAHFIEQSARDRTVGDAALDADELASVLARAERATDDRKCAAERALGAAIALDPIFEGRGQHDARFAALSRAIALAERAGYGRGSFAEGLLRRALASLDLEHAGDAADDVKRAGALAERGGGLGFALGRLAWREGRIGDAQAAFEIAVARFAALSETRREAQARARLARTFSIFGDFDRARALLLEAIVCFDNLGDRRGASLARLHLAISEADAGLLREAETQLAAVTGELDDAGIAAAETCFGFVAIESGALDRARACFENALAIRTRAGDARGVAIATYELTLAGEVAGASDVGARFTGALNLLQKSADPLHQGLAGCAVARQCARLGDIEGAYAALVAAEARLAADGPTAWARVAEIARAEIALSSNDRATAERILVESEIGETSAELRVARRLLEVRLWNAAPRDLPRPAAVGPPPPAVLAAKPDEPNEPPGDALVVAASGRWYCVAGSEPVSLSTKRALRLMMKSLADLREATPGRAAPLADLLEAAWPGERVHPEAGASRVYAAVATLRKAGLRDVLVRRDDGYLFDPKIPLFRAGDDDPPRVRKKL